MSKNISQVELTASRQRLEELAAKVSQCRRCPLWEMATNSVPGEGNPDPELVFVGEAPGYHEDQQGRPFVGQAGQLLTAALEEIGLSRSDVYICNMLKHRPPGNRDPSEAEIGACRFWLDQQLGILKPRLIVTLGRFSLAHFIPLAKISKIHGQGQVVDHRLILPLYHPAAALRSAEIMAVFKSDFRTIPNFLSQWEELLTTNELAPAAALPEDQTPENEEQLVLI